MHSEEAKELLLNLMRVSQHWGLDPVSDEHRVAPFPDDSRELAREIGLLFEAMGLDPSGLQTMDAESVGAKFGRVIALLLDEREIELEHPGEHESAPLTAAEVELIHAYRAGQLPILEEVCVRPIRSEAEGP